MYGMYWLIGQLVQYFKLGSGCGLFGPCPNERGVNLRGEVVREKQEVIRIFVTDSTRRGGGIAFSSC